MGHLEKARELTGRFHKMGGLFPVTTYGHARQCAITHVEELIKELVIMEIDYELDLALDFKYWQEVLYWLKSNFLDAP